MEAKSQLNIEFYHKLSSALVGYKHELEYLKTKCLSSEYAQFLQDRIDNQDYLMSTLEQNLSHFIDASLNDTINK
jgi:hypothetical protein